MQNFILRYAEFKLPKLSACIYFPSVLDFLFLSIIFYSCQSVFSLCLVKYQPIINLNSLSGMMDLLLDQRIMNFNPSLSNYCFIDKRKVMWSGVWTWETVKCVLLFLWKWIIWMGCSFLKVAVTGLTSSTALISCAYCSSEGRSHSPLSHHEGLSP